MKALVAHNLSKRFGGLHALRDVGLDIEAGECRVIIGPNGAGKTTLFHLLSGVMPPSAGRIALFGEDITQLPPHVRAMKGLARTFQVSSLFPRLTVEENVLLAAQARYSKFAMYRPAVSYQLVMARVEQVLQEGKLVHKRKVPVRFLSHGEHRQLEVMLALAAHPKVVLLDEPTAGLSEVERKQMTAFLQSMRGTVTIVLVSHDIDVAFALADYVSVLHLGELLVEGTPDVVRLDPRVMSIYLGDDKEPARA